MQNKTAINGLNYMAKEGVKVTDAVTGPGYRL